MLPGRAVLGGLVLERMDRAGLSVVVGELPDDGSGGLKRHFTRHGNREPFIPAFEDGFDAAALFVEFHDDSSDADIGVTRHGVRFPQLPAAAPSRGRLSRGGVGDSVGEGRINTGWVRGINPKNFHALSAFPQLANDNPFLAPVG